MLIALDPCVSISIGMCWKIDYLYRRMNAAISSVVLWNQDLHRGSVSFDTRFSMRMENQKNNQSIKQLWDQWLWPKIPGKISIHLQYFSKMNSLSSPYAGDIIILQAVDIPELHCLQDVLVFSTQGDRKSQKDLFLSRKKLLPLQDRISIK